MAAENVDRGLKLSALTCAIALCLPSLCRGSWQRFSPYPGQRLKNERIEGCFFVHLSADFRVELAPAGRWWKLDVVGEVDIPEDGSCRLFIASEDAGHVAEEVILWWCTSGVSADGAP